MTSRILHVHKDFAPRRGGGGVARHIEGLAMVMAGAGAEVRVIAHAPDVGDAPLPYTVRDVSLSELWRQVSWADTVHVHGARQPLAACAALLAGLRGCRVVYTPHCYYDHGGAFKRLGKRAWDVLVEAVLLRRASLVVLLDLAWLAYLQTRRLAVAHPLILPNCVLASSLVVRARRRGGLSGQPAILSVGRLDAVKRLEDAIGALGEPGLSGAVLHVVGSGPDQARLAALAERAGVSGRVQWYGFVDDAGVAGMAAGADVFVLPSAVEGLPTVLIEMLLRRCPVVASDIPGNRALLQPLGLDGLYPLGDVAALAGCLQRVAGGTVDDEIVRRAQAGFTWEGLRTRVRALYET